MAERSPEGWTDRDCLEALDLRDHEGLRYVEIAARLGRSKSSVCGLLNRIDKESAAADPDGRGNGTLPRRWWAADGTRRKEGTGR